MATILAYVVAIETVPWIPRLTVSRTGVVSVTQNFARPSALCCL